MSELCEEFSMSKYASRDDLYAAMLREIASLRARVEPRQQWTVGQLIAALSKENHPRPVLIEHEDGPRNASHLGSYRGYYEQLAISSSTGKPLSVGDLLDALRKKVGDTVTGYKGGTFRITEDTPLWAAEYGECGSMIVGLDLRGDVVTLMTEADD